MTRRAFKDEVFMGIAACLAELSTCDRKLVGAVVVKDGRCVTWGFNGAPPGMPHCDENNHGHGLPGGPSAHPEDDNDWLKMKLKTEGCRNAVHAEANALAFAARHGISTAGATLYVTLAPCLSCAQLIIASGISRVVALEAYRDTAGADLLKRASL